jgi:hypothetical protein
MSPLAQAFAVGVTAMIQCAFDLLSDMTLGCAVALWLLLTLPLASLAGRALRDTPCPEERRAHDALGELGEVRFHNSGDTRG